jgi:MFS family permease
MRAGRYGALALLMLAQYFYAWGWSTADVLRPQLRGALNLSLAEAGAGYSAQVVATVIGAWLISRLTRRAGAAVATATMMAGYGAAVIALVYVASFPGFLAARFVYGLFAGGIFPVTVAVYFALFPAEARGRIAGLIDACFYLAVISLGIALARIAPGDWQLLLWLGGLPAIVLAPLALVLLPGRQPAPERGADGATARGGLLRPEVRRRTIGLVVLMGANSFGYQCFIGWLTTYLEDVRQFDQEGVGTVIATLYAVNAAATFLWGWLVDRYGRRTGLLGPALCATAIALVLAVRLPPELTGLLAALYGLGFAATVCLGPWIAEMFPPDLRLAATSLFQWGRLVSLFTPLITGAFAQHAGLPAAMALGIAAFALSTVVWWRLPETLSRAQSGASRMAQGR